MANDERNKDRLGGGPPEQFASVPPPTTGTADHSFTLQAIMDLQRTIGGTTEAIRLLTLGLDRQSTQLGKIDDLRVDIGKIETQLNGLSNSLSGIEGRVDRIRSWIIGAGAIIAFIVIAASIGAQFVPNPWDNGPQHQEQRAADS